MKHNAPITIQQIFNNNGSAFSQLAQKVTQLQTINQQLQAILPDELKSHCHVANLRNGCLVIAAENAGWLTHLRFNASTILTALQQPRHTTIKELHFIIASAIPTAQMANRQE